MVQRLGAGHQDASLLKIIDETVKEKAKNPKHEIKMFVFEGEASRRLIIDECDIVSSDLLVIESKQAESDISETEKISQKRIKSQVRQGRF